MTSEQVENMSQKGFAYLKPEQMFRLYGSRQLKDSVPKVIFQY